MTVGYMILFCMMLFHGFCLLCAGIDLTKECEQLKKASESSGSGEGVAWEELQVVRSERDQATSEAKSLKLSVTSLEQKNQVL